MRLKIPSLIAAALFVTACETTPETMDDAATESMVEDAAMVDEMAMADEIDPRTLEYVSETYGDRVFFDFDSSVVRPDAESTIRDWANWMQSYPDIAVMIEGHCDERGTREYNLALGERRANAVRNVLIALGVDPMRIETISYGKERPAVEGHMEEAWSQNRRGVVILD